jgi:undecaprenyl diphosphate synthase
LDQIIPQHVAIIMDGNGRWALRQGLPRTYGHKKGVDVIRNVVEFSLQKGIKVLSLWAFGRDNWSRPIAEVDYLMQLFLHVLQNERDILHKQGVKLCFTGNRLELSALIQQEIIIAEELTAKNCKMILNIVFNYSGHWDIMQAVKRISYSVVHDNLDLDSIDEDMVAKYLSTRDLPDPDLFIRTSGEQRISNFYLWQIAYTELYFSNLCWPEFDNTEFEKALEWFALRERRYGKISEQLLEEDYV